MRQADGRQVRPFRTFPCLLWLPGLQIHKVVPDQDGGKVPPVRRRACRAALKEGQDLLRLLQLPGVHLRRARPAHQEALPQVRRPHDGLGQER